MLFVSFNSLIQTVVLEIMAICIVLKRTSGIIQMDITINNCFVSTYQDTTQRVNLTVFVYVYIELLKIYRQILPSGTPISWKIYCPDRFRRERNFVMILTLTYTEVEVFASDQ